MLRTSGMWRTLTMAFALLAGSSAFAADNGIWSVSKSSGEVWITATGAQPASLKQEDTLKPGDAIRTGRNGRVLLVRGEETILIAPNSVISVPAEKKDGMSTTIQQQAGSILLEVEKRNVKHFEVETPYLAAVVKGTQFSVTIDGTSTRVEVSRGQVEVSDFKSGQIAQVLPGQAATSFAHGKPGLSLSGAGTFMPIEHGKPRASTIDRVPVPKGGLPEPRNAGEGKTIHAVAPAGATGKETAKAAAKPGLREAKAESGHAKRGVVRISSALGEVKVNVNKATHGLAHGATTPGYGRHASRDGSPSDTIWNDNKSSVSSAYASTGSGSYTTAGGSTAAAAMASPSSSLASTSSSSNGNGGGNGNGNNGNGNGNGGATGNGKVAGNGNGNAGGNGNGNAGGNGNGNNGNGNNGNGNGNGNGGVGNGNGNGNAKH